MEKLIEILKLKVFWFLYIMIAGWLVSAITANTAGMLFTLTGWSYILLFHWPKVD